MSPFQDILISPEAKEIRLQACEPTGSVAGRLRTGWDALLRRSLQFDGHLSFMGTEPARW